jgi:dTDP-4-dehydrorhamnose 3,5-epimerase
MKVEETEIPGLISMINPKFSDKRGDFLKVFSVEEVKKEYPLNSFCESYYSRSVRNVIRGMHFQIPPFEQQKLVYVTEGEIIDVVVDLRKKSPSFGTFVKVHLTAFGDSLLIPQGCAHGFLTVSDFATVVYNVTSTYSPKHDSGIRWDSFGFEWNGIKDPILSDRDKLFPSFNNFNSPFE